MPDALHDGPKFGENGAIIMDIHEPTEQWHQVMKSLRAVWAKLRAEVYPVPFEVAAKRSMGQSATREGLP